MSQILPVNNFEWIEDISQFIEDNGCNGCNEESDKRYSLKVDIKYIENLYELHNGLRFLPQGMKIE